MLNQKFNRGLKFIFSKFLTSLLILLFLSTNISAQGKAEVYGKIVDSKTGEPLIGANVVMKGTTMGAAADIDGNYKIKNVPAGKYTLVFSVISYTEKTVTGVKLEPGEMEKIDITLTPETIQTEEIVVTAKALKNTEAGMLKDRQKSNSVSDAISAEEITAAGASNAADAVQKVVGATVVEGKYVYVRGLGNRYSSTQLNGAELPSSDPNKKAFQLDLLPSNLLSNIVTIKTFTPDKPGNFSGGIVDIGTKSFPESFTLKFSTSASFHSQATLNSDYLTYKGGNKDWLGYDDGTRELPGLLDNPNTDVPSEVASRFDSEKAAKLDAYTKAFNSTMDIKRETAPVNQGYSFSIGNQISTGRESSLGYSGSITYGRDFSYYENGEVGIYKLNEGSSVMNDQLKLSDSEGTTSTNLGALGAFNYNISREHQVGGNVFYSRSATSTARYQQGVWLQELGNKRVVMNRVLGFKERDILSTQLRGEHLLSGLFSMTVDWNVSLSTTRQKEPDQRLVFSYADTTKDPDIHTVVGSNFDDPSRYFRDLEDNSNTYNLNLTLPFAQWNGLMSKFKFGGTYQNSDRVFNERIFSYDVNNQYFRDVNGDVGELFDNKYNGIVDADTSSTGRVRYTFGNVIRDNSKPKNNYTGEQKIAAFYGMFEMPISRRLKFVGGLRYETTETEVVSEDKSQEVGKITEEDFLPSFNLIYQLSEDMNLRVAATQTLARPNFREVAPYSSKEFVNGYELQGNPNLQRTLIQNYDVRWEWFKRPGEIFAVSGFYKKMENPIERAFETGTTESNRIITYRNVDNATILGAEFEARMNLDFISEELSNFSVGTNLSLVKSEIDIPESELNARKAIDSTSGTTRELQGQSPYILNIDLSYNNLNRGTSASLHFNTFGERLSKVSANLTPDVYEQPAAKLDLVISQSLYQGLSIKLSAKNILDSPYKEVYKYRGDEYIFQKYNRGVSYSFGLSYDL